MQFIRKAFSATKHEMLISLGIVLALTVILSIIFYIVESIAQPDVYRDYWDALVWAYTRYMEGGDGVFEGGPVTVTGKAIASLLGLIGIALVAIPAGLVGSGFMDAIAEEKREEELAQMHQRMLKQYPRFSSGAFNDYCRALSEGCPEQFKNAHFTTRAELLSRFQTRLGLDFKDIADVCNTYPELRLRDMADEISDEQNPVSTFVVELLPVNTSYGCFVNRESDVTIMVTNGFEEMGTSWFGYHIALLGGFNFICKNQEADPDERDSYYSLSDTATKEQMQMRNLFLKDLQSVSGKGKWVINLQSAIRSSRNKVDFHFIYDNRDHNKPSVENVKDVEKLIAAVNEAFSKAPFDDAPHIAQQSELYRLNTKNIAYKVRETSEGTNFFHIRIASNLINMDLRRSVVMYILADRIRQAFVPQQPLREEDKRELQSNGYGYFK
jgi:voltage-gated potassium channel